MPPPHRNGSSPEGALPPLERGALVPLPTGSVWLQEQGAL
jgi:hypothetical protein